MLPVVQPHTSSDPFGQFHDLIVGVTDAKGMNTRRTAAGRYVPDASVERILAQCFRTNAGNASTVIPSMPGAPALVLTRRQAACRFSEARICSIMVLLPSVSILPGATALTKASPFRRDRLPCPLPGRNAPVRFGPSRHRVFRSLRLNGLFPAPGSLLGTMASADSLPGCPVRVSPGKNALLPGTTAAFTCAHGPSGFAVLCQLAGARRPC